MLLFPLFIAAQSLDNTIQKAHDLHLAQARYWHLLLHMRDGISEIDDAHFFLAKNGKYSAREELDATLYALYNEKVYDDNATACKFPARKAWLVQKLKLSALPKVRCKHFDKIEKKLDPISATVVFPSAHINSPASMFGHTFLRINSKYNSKLLSYAINYAADINETQTSGIAYALKGLFGGYIGYYSMLPYYDKLKEYRDSEQRDIWEYDLTLTRAEVRRMFLHIWELNGIGSDYFFLTENCSYNILWLLEIAKGDIDLKKHFVYQVSPLETIHAMREEGMIQGEYFRASKRRVLLAYEKALRSDYIQKAKRLAVTGKDTDRILHDKSIPIAQKRTLFEAAVELLEYRYIQGKVKKENYLTIFHTLTSARAQLGIGKMIVVKKPISPLKGHRQARVTLGMGYEEKEMHQLLGARPVYHDIKDSSVGLLRGTQIEFFNTLLRLARNDIGIERFTLLSISSFAQRSEFVQPFSWRMHFQWDRDYMDSQPHFNAMVAGGGSWGNRYGYFYGLLEGFVYKEKHFAGGLGATLGLVLDGARGFQTNLELRQRWYDEGSAQLLLSAIQSYRFDQNLQLRVGYDYKQATKRSPKAIRRYNASLNYYF